MPKSKWTVKEVTSKIMMVTGAISAVTGCVKQIIEVAGCKATKHMAYYLDDSRWQGPPPPPPPPPTWLENFIKEVTPFYGIAFLVLGILLILIARRLRTT